MKQPSIYFCTILLIPLFFTGCKHSQSENENAGYFFTVCLDEPGELIWNVADNVNIWYYSPVWHETAENEPDDYFRTHLPFVKYVQLMTSAGGNLQRDLFKNPSDRLVTDDYDFEPLIRACRNIVQKGLTPHLKLGNVPLKYSNNPVLGKDFDVNLLPPYDYNMWHAYIIAMISSLADTFGVETVKGWRFGAITEYENCEWFSVNKDPVKTRDAYFKLYDYTVDAVQQVLGEDICFGAHSMTVFEGLWDERELIAHCAHGKNLCTEKTGTQLSFLATSYYDGRPGKYKGNLARCINHLRDAAKKEGLNNLFYGVDEGRILTGFDGKPLVPRDVGYTWQAASDAKMYRLMLDNDIDYFSYWAYTSRGLFGGIPSVSAQTTGLFCRMIGAARLPVETIFTNDEKWEDTGIVAALDKAGEKLYLFFYAYTDSVFHSNKRDIICEIPGFRKGTYSVKSMRTLISDESNFFDEWTEDWKTMGMTADDFEWSSDSYQIYPLTVKDSVYVKAFYDKEEYYRSLAQLKPVMEKLKVKNGNLRLHATIPDHGVLLYEIPFHGEL